MEAFLNILLPRVLHGGATFEIHAFQGKSDLLGKLEQRLRGYRRWLPSHWKLVVLVDRDNDDCLKLKARLEASAANSGFRTRSQATSQDWHVVNRIAIEELEAWYFGDWEAVRAVYPRVNQGIPGQARYRNPDAIKGGTWEAFERILKRHGYFSNGLRKTEAAKAIAAHTTPDQNRSRSFNHFLNALTEAAA